MSRATVQDQTFLGHQGGGYMRQHPQPGGPGAGPRRPSRLMQMKEGYQRRMTKEKEEMTMKEKEEKLTSLFQEQQRRHEQRAERLTKASGLHQEEYPNSRLRQPGYMQQVIQPPPASSNNHHDLRHSPSLRDFFRERHELEAKGDYVPPIGQHFKDSRRPGQEHRMGSGHRKGSGQGGKNSAGVDRANPLAPIQARHAGVSSAPTRDPLLSRTYVKPGLQKQTSLSPDLDVHAPAQVRPAVGKPSQPKKTSAGKRRQPKPSGAGSEKLSDFQKWQMEQNKAREERLRKLNMRPAPPSERESRDWGRDYEYEEEEEEEQEVIEEEREEEEGGESERRKRMEQELLERIAQQQAALDRLRKEREEEEELERQEAEALRKQQAADRERRRRQQQEEERRRRQEEAVARKEEEEQRRATRARQERERFQAKLDQYGESAYDHSAPNSHRDNPFRQPNSRRDEPFRQPKSHRDEPFQQPNSRRDNPFQQPNPRHDEPSQPNSHRGGSVAHNSNNNHHNPSALDTTTPNYTPKPPSEAPTPRNRGPKPSPARHPPQQHHPSQQRRASMPSEQYDEVPVPGPGIDFYAQAVDEEQGTRVRTVPCKVCGRHFAEDRLQKHQSACKNAHKKRQTFDPTQMRTEGTDMAKYVRQGAHKKEHQVKKKADWRRQHQEFITNIRYAKQMTQMEQQGVALKDLPPPPPSMANPDLVPCPHCGRSFNEQAAERHIPRCQELKTRPVPNSRRRH